MNIRLSYYLEDTDMKMIGFFGEKLANYDCFRFDFIMFLLFFLKGMLDYLKENMEKRFKLSSIKIKQNMRLL